MVEPDFDAVELNAVICYGDAAGRWARAYYHMYLEI